jgi:mannose-6-phosphate isomerase
LGGEGVRPYKTNPAIVERPWGGSKLQEYNKDIRTDAIGESWETGPLGGNVPVLIKLIDAKEALSVQVHPNDEFALKVENEPNGKSEAWIVLECEEDSFIIYGFNRKVKKNELRNLLKNGMISKVLNYVKVRKGDCIFIPAGTVHSIGKGILAYEVQQPSDLTYRIYDWNRTDSRGKGRELHIDKAVEAIDYFCELPEITNIYDSIKNGCFNVVECKHFGICYKGLSEKELHRYESGIFRVITTACGSTALKFEDSQLFMKKGDTCIIPKEYYGMVSIEGLEASEYIITTCNY